MSDKARYVEMSQSAFVRGFIDDATVVGPLTFLPSSQSAFVRGFIDDLRGDAGGPGDVGRLNPRSCAASSMTEVQARSEALGRVSQSAFVRGFIDDTLEAEITRLDEAVSIRVRARLHR